MIDPFGALTLYGLDQEVDPHALVAQEDISYSQLSPKQRRAIRDSLKIFANITQMMGFGVTATLNCFHVTLLGIEHAIKPIPPLVFNGEILTLKGFQTAIFEFSCHLRFIAFPLSAVSALRKAGVLSETTLSQLTSSWQPVQQSLKVGNAICIATVAILTLVNHYRQGSKDRLEQAHKLLQLAGTVALVTQHPMACMLATAQLTVGLLQLYMAQMH